VEQRRWNTPITALCGFGTKGDSIPMEEAVSQ